MPKETSTYTKTYELAGEIPSIKLFRYGKLVRAGITRINPEEFCACLEIFRQARCHHQVPQQLDFVLPTDRNNFITFSYSQQPIEPTPETSDQSQFDGVCKKSECYTRATLITFNISYTQFVTYSNIEWNPKHTKENRTQCPNPIHRVRLPHFPALLDQLNQQYLDSLRTPTPEPVEYSSSEYYEDEYDCYSDSRESVPDPDCYQNCFD